MTLFLCLGLVTLAVACEEHAVVLDTGVGIEVFDEVTGIDIKAADVVDVEGLDDAAVEVAGGTFKVFEELLEKNTASGGNWQDDEGSVNDDVLDHLLGLASAAEHIIVDIGDGTTVVVELACGIFDEALENNVTLGSQVPAFSADILREETLGVVVQTTLQSSSDTTAEEVVDEYDVPEVDDIMVPCEGFWAS